MAKFKRFFVFLLVLCIFTSFVACGKKDEEQILDLETRTPIIAVEGRDYTIDYVRASVANFRAENGQIVYMGYDELREEIARRKEYGEEIHFRITVKFTAINELSSASAGLNVQFWNFEGGSKSRYYGDSKGNTGSEILKSENILPGTHYLHFDVDLSNTQPGFSDMYAIENLDGLDEELVFAFYTY